MADKSDNSIERFTRRFGIGEWYGQLFIGMTPDERKAFAALQSQKNSRECPFQSNNKLCTKKGGVCSIRLYQRSSSGEVAVADGDQGRLRTVCPYRFDESGLVYRWVSEEILGSVTHALVSEVGFLEKLSPLQRSEKEDVGRIDKVVVVPGTEPLDWCALEAQAVYFSGSSMSQEWPAILRHQSSGIPFPVGNRRPDYRSSGPKRLMPQLQIKVPTLRRWGKKMAVVVDLDFWEALGTMDEVSNVSNCDIAWFIVQYTETGNKASLVRGKVQLTTLERAVEGLTAGRPVNLDEFESRIRSKLR